MCDLHLNYKDYVGITFCCLLFLPKILLLKLYFVNYCKKLGHCKRTTSKGSFQSPLLRFCPQTEKLVRTTNRANSAMRVYCWKGFLQGFRFKDWKVKVRSEHEKGRLTVESSFSFVLWILHVTLLVVWARVTQASCLGWTQYKRLNV